MVYSDKYKFLPNVETHDVDMGHTFLHLTDTPTTYSGFEYVFIKVNDDRDGVDFTPIRFLDLADTPTTYSGLDYVFLKISDDKSGVEFTPINFVDLADIPSFSGCAGAYTIVNDTEDGVEFVYPQTTPFSVNVYDEGFPVQNTPHQTLNFVGNLVSVVDSGNEVATITISGTDSSLFGTNCTEAHDEDTSYTTSTSWQEKLTLEVSGIPEGKYRIGWFYEWSLSNSNWRFCGRVQIDDTTTVAEKYERPSEGSWGAWQSDGGFVYVDLTLGDHFVDIDYKTTHFNKTAGIRRARIEFWRIS